MLFAFYYKSQLRYLGLHLGIGTVSCCLLQQYARIEPNVFKF